MASYSGVAKNWEQKGHRVLHKSVSQPYFPLIATAKISQTQIEAIRKSLEGMPATEAGREVLTRIGVKEFDGSSERRLRELLIWLER